MKKGQSNIIVTVVLILIILAAVVIVWTVVNKVAEEGAEDIDVTQFSLRADIESFSLMDNFTAEVRVKRGSGEGNIIAIKLIFEDFNGAAYYYENDTWIPGVLETKVYRVTNNSLSPTISDFMNIKKVSVYYVYKTDAGKEKTSLQLDTRDVGGGGIGTSSAGCIAGEIGCQEEIAVEICGDWYDNDGDGFVNEGCILSLEKDTDNDNMPDDLEIVYFDDLSQNSDGDYDSDGVLNLDEFMNYTNPKYRDSDFDDLNDLDELTIGSDPIRPDSDGDGYSDKEEVDSGTDFFHKNNMNFQFNSYDGIHYREVDGIIANDTGIGRLRVMPWMELTSPDTIVESRDISMFEIAKRGIEYWSGAGAAHIGFVGEYSWMQDQDLNIGGYQNARIEELRDLSNQHNIKIVFGVKLNSLVNGDTSKAIEPWEELFLEPKAGNNFDLLGQLMRDITSFTGNYEWIIEEETPLRTWIPEAYRDGLLNLTEENFDNLKGNYDLLCGDKNIIIHFWHPFPYLNSTKNLFLNVPVSRDNIEEIRKYVGTKMYVMLNDSLGDKLKTFGMGPTYFINGGTSKTVPFTSERTDLFKELEKNGLFSYQQDFFVFRPYLYMYSKYTASYGPAETVLSLPYFFGRNLNNSAYPHISFDGVFIYPGITFFDISALGMREYVKNGVSLIVLPQQKAPTADGDSINETRRITIIIKVHQEPQKNLNFFINASSIIDNNKEDYFIFEPLSDNRGAVFSWIPSLGRSQDGTGKNYSYYWVDLKVSDNEQLNSMQSIRIRVNAL